MNLYTAFEAISEWRQKQVTELPLHDSVHASISL